LIDQRESKVIALALKIKSKTSKLLYDKIHENLVKTTAPELRHTEVKISVFTNLNGGANALIVRDQELFINYLLAHGL
jgi:hypothetical protein